LLAAIRRRKVIRRPGLSQKRQATKQEKQCPEVH
jgi:hypothetical protein